MKGVCWCSPFSLPLSVLLRFVLSPCQGTPLAMGERLELGKASVSIYPHHYPHLAPVAQYTEFSLQSSVRKMTVTSGERRQVITDQTELQWRAAVMDVPQKGSIHARRCLVLYLKASEPEVSILRHILNSLHWSEPHMVSVSPSPQWRCAEFSGGYHAGTFSDRIRRLTAI